VSAGAFRYSADSPVSPVRMRTTSSTVVTKILAVADAAGAGCGGDGLDHGLHVVVLDDDLELHLGQEVDDVLGSPVEFGVAALAAEPLHLADGDALDSDAAQASFTSSSLKG